MTGAVVAGLFAALVVSDAGRRSTARAGETVPVLTRLQVVPSELDPSAGEPIIEVRAKIVSSRNWDAPPFWFGHKGNEFPYPENTMLAFTRSVEKGLRMLEIDIGTSADGHLVVFHDVGDISRTTDGEGALKDHTLEALRALDAGAYAGAGYAGERIPTLREVFEFALDNECVLMLNLKDAGVPAIRSLVEETGFPIDLLWFLTENDAQRDAVNESFPEAVQIHWVGMSAQSPGEQTVDGMMADREAGVSGYSFIDFSQEARWTKEDVERIHAAGLWFGVNAPRQNLVEPYLERGVDLFLLGNPGQAPLDLTPFEIGEAVLRAPSGQEMRIPITETARVSGDGTLGEYVSRARLPDGVPAGDWTVAVRLRDAEGRESLFGEGGDELPAGATARISVGPGLGAGQVEAPGEVDEDLPIPAATETAPDPQSFEHVVDYRAETVVVYNRNRPDSKEIAEFYVKARGIPEANLVALDCPSGTAITRAEYSATIEGALRREFTERGWWITKDPGPGRRVQAVENSKRILVLVRGVPLKINEFHPGEEAGTGGGGPAADPRVPPGKEDRACIDSELSLLGLFDSPVEGPLNNPFFKSGVSFAKANMPAMMLVGRLDGPGPQIVKRMITDAIEAEKTGLWGKVYIDLAQKTGAGYEQGEEWLKGAANIYAVNGYPVIVDVHKSRFPLNYPMGDAIAYFGWYHGQVDGPFLNPDFRFRPGAVACHIHSFSANTLGHPSANWVGPLVARGAAAALGNVFEPYLNFTHHLDVFNVRLLQGFTYIEAAYQAMPVLSWMGVAVGDPLYRPFKVQVDLGDRKVDADYKALRIAFSRWGRPELKDELVSNVERAAANLKSGNLHEALGLMTMRPGSESQASAHFDQAYAAFRQAPDRLRVRLHQVELLRSLGQTEQAAARLRELQQEFASIPEAKAVEALLLELDPPPPGTKPKGPADEPEPASGEAGSPDDGTADEGAAGDEEARRRGFRFNRPGRR